jgi:hypothetical protein
MIMRKTIMAVAWMCGLSAPAFATDYYVAAHYTSTNGDGQSALLINGDSVHTADAGYRIVTFAAVNGGGTAMSVYSAQFECADKSWRVTGQKDYYTADPMAPVDHATNNLPAFNPVNDGTPIAGAMAMVCGWPSSQTGAAKFSAADPISLSKLVSPTLQFTPPPDNGN